MISFELILYCFLAGAVYLLGISLLLDVIAKSPAITRSIPEVMLPGSRGTVFAVSFIIEFLFFVFIPTLAYSLFYLLIPFTGLRAGLAAALFAFTLGSVPALIGLGLRVNFPMPYLLFTLLSLLVKLGGCLSLIAYLYAL